MRKRGGVKKVKHHIRSTDEYQQIQAPLQDSDQHLFRFSPNYEQVSAQEHLYETTPSNQLIEYFKVGAIQADSARKQNTKKGSQSGSGMKLRLVSSSTSQTIDAPTIINNILSTPIKTNINHFSHGQALAAKSNRREQVVKGSTQNSSSGPTNSGLAIQNGEKASNLVDQQTNEKQFFNTHHSQRIAQTDEHQWASMDSKLAKLQLIKLLKGNAPTNGHTEQHTTGKQPFQVQITLKNQHKKSESPLSRHHETSGAKQDFIKTCLSTEILGKPIHPLMLSVKTHHSHQQPSKRQLSAPKLRSGQTNKRHGNHQTQHSLPKSKKTRQNSSVSRASARAKSYQQQLASHEKCVGRPPLLQQQSHITTTQMRVTRSRSKINSQPVPYHLNNVSGPIVPQSSKLKNAASRENEKSPAKSLAAIAIGLRASQCQSALQQQNEQHALFLNNAKTPTSKQLKEIFRANKTTSNRHLKRDLLEKPEVHTQGNTLGNTLTQSISKINACSQHQIGKPAQKVSSKRNELANYLTKILDQQQKMQLNTFDQTQQHYNPQTANLEGCKNARSTKGASSSKGGLSKQIISHVATQGNLGSANLAVNSKFKKSTGVVMLREHQQNARQQPKNDYQYLISRKSQPISNTKRNTNNPLNESEDLRLRHLLLRFSNVKEGQSQQSQASQQYLASNSIAGKQQSSSTTGAAAQQQNSILFMKHQKKLQQDQQSFRKAENITATSVEKKKGNIQSRDYVTNQNILLASKIQRAIQDRKEALDQIEFSKKDFTQHKQLGKSFSERNFVKQKKEDLMASQHTIVNINTHGSQNEPFYEETSDNQSARAKSRSTRVEYHSDRELCSVTHSRQAPQLSNHVSTDKNNERLKEVYHSVKQPIIRAERGVQTSSLATLLPSMTHKETVEVSRRGDKLDSAIISNQTPSRTETEIAELAVWTREKAALEAYSLFFVEQLEPFTRNLFYQLEGQPSQLLTKVIQQVDIFGIRHDQAFSKEERKNSVIADLIYKMSSRMILTFQKLAKVASDEIFKVQKVAETEVQEKAVQLESLKDQVRKFQKEIFVRSEKLHLSEQMLKLKDKEVTTLRNKINAMAEASERAAKEHAKIIQRKDQEQELNFVKTARELKTLYEQNKDLFEHNRALRDDLQDQDEKVRKLVSVIQRHSSVVRVIEQELDKTETKIHDQSQISNAIPTSQREIYDFRKIPHQGDSKKPLPLGVTYVGHNRVAIPKFDPVIIEKFNKLNIEGKLPHIVETNKFNPDAVKQQVKDIFRKINQFSDHQFEDFKTPDPIQPMQSVLKSSGIGNVTPYTPLQHYQKQLQFDVPKDYQENSIHDSDMSGGERKRNEAHLNVMKKILHVNSPAGYFYDNRPSNYNSALISQQQYRPINQELLQAVPAYQISGGSPMISNGIKLPIKIGEVSTPAKKPRKSTDGAEFEAGPQKDRHMMGLIQKQHQAHTIVTLQNQLYHQLINKNMAGVYTTPNNQQVPIYQEQQSSNQPNIMSPLAAFRMQQSPQKDFSSNMNVADFFCQDQIGNQLVCDVSPDFQSVDQPSLNSRSQTATLALELTEGLHLQQSNQPSIGFDQVLVSNTQLNKHLHMNLQQLTISVHPGTSYQGQFGNRHISLQRVMYEEEKEGLSGSMTNQQVEENTTLQVPRSGSIIRPAGATLQDQISKQYSPILRRHESLENMNEDEFSSPSLINERNELSNQDHHRHRKQQHLTVIRTFGLGSVDAEKSVSLPDSIAIKEEDSTQKKYIEPQESSDHGGNEQGVNSSQQIYVDPIRQQRRHLGDFHQSAQSYLAQGYLYEQQSPNEILDRGYSPHLQIMAEQKNYEFENSEAPLDLSRVENNFDSAINNDQSDQNSGDILLDLNFAQQVQGRRSPDDGFEDGRRLSSQERLL